MSRSMINTITNVIGFNLKNTVTKVVETDGTIKLLKGGVRSTVSAVKPQPIVHKECNPKWFTNFNQTLLDKIKDYHKNN